VTKEFKEGGYKEDEGVEQDEEGGVERDYCNVPFCDDQGKLSKI
jgi:hypothetical protein